MTPRILNSLGSLKLTVICLCAAVALVFVGTLAQVHEGLYMAQSRYFRSLLVFWTVPGTPVHIPVFPGGYLVGAALVVNLVAAQLARLPVSRKNAGLYLIHGGILLLLFGQFATDLWQVESHMRLIEGQAMNYSESDRYSELAIIDTSAPAYDQVVAVPESRLEAGSEIKAQDVNVVSFGRSQSPRQTGQEIRLENLPFTLKVKDYFVNSRLAERDPHSSDPAPATQGIGANVKLTPLPAATRTDERNLPTAIIEIIGGKGSLGTWLISLMLEEKQRVTIGQKTFALVMRPVRYYKNHSLELLKFRHEKYSGSDIPKQYSSRARVRNSLTGEDREVLIYMNNPLRYDGETYYQSSFDKRDPRVSIFQVVRNPGWLTPYLSCTLVGLGLLIHFLRLLFNFLQQRRTA